MHALNRKDRVQSADVQVRDGWAPCQWGNGIGLGHHVGAMQPFSRLIVRPRVPHYSTRFCTSSITTSGSASVEVSPKLSVSFAAILRRIRRMILPLRVFGRPGAH